MESKTIKDLEREVWMKGACSGCGACVAVCPADAIYFPAGSALTPTSAGYCKAETDGIPCGACYTVCPRTALEIRSGLGTYQEIVAARSTFEVERKQSGGAVTALLLTALEEGMIDAVVTVSEDRWTLKPSSVVITSTEALVHQAGSRYSWWVPLLTALKEAVVTRKYRRIAVVGVPCVVQAAKALRRADHDLLRPFGRSIRLVIGLFCTESFDYEKLVENKLKREYNIEPWQIRRLDVKGQLEVTHEDGSVISVPLDELKSSVRPGCHLCTDFTAVDADVSAGSVGSPAGYTTLIIRNDVGRGFVDRAIWRGRLATSGDINVRIIERLAGQKAQKDI
ncbi:putative coenzyme f420-dependent oxidoreductase [hydrocarbon metagenome]|uniref:Putative coenzyme f420-dependent oxidoreductase n=1 Tax=hydrocarbon metagenome TaxID=938273 RepID=A0A0W8FJI0_9ZZZZ|nr:Coenzyme F420 hydrogenase/dehydrogenase, beta subunit C-terminal domain [Methanomicrobiaceae archaeon]